MKFIWFGLVTFLLTSRLTATLIPPNVIRQCVDSTQIPAVDLALFYGTDYLMVSRPVKCYITCILETTGIAVNGKISEDFIQMGKNSQESEKLKLLTEVCSNMNVEGDCEPTFEAFKCWLTRGKH